MSEAEGRILQLNDTQRSTLQSFQEIASIDDEYLCMQILQQNNWDLNLALSQFLGHAADDNAVVGTTNTSRTEGRNVTRRARGNDSISNTRSASNTNVLIDTQQNRSRPDPSEGTGGLFGLLFVPLRWLFQARPLSLNPEQDTLKFIDEYNMKFTANHPNFHAGSYQSAVATAYERSKFLLVYLHSPLHEDTPRFCRDTLASSSVITYANENMITWTGSVWDPEAYNLSTQLRATTFPFVALLICQSNRTVQIADKIQGYVEESVFMERVQRNVNMHMSVITQNQREAQRREEAVRLRAQQDREYRESAEADRLAVIRQREEAAEREIAEEEARQAEELAAAQELSRRLTEEDTLRKLRGIFEAAPEPAVGPTVSAVRFQLPSGKKLSRRFGKADTVQRLFDYLTLSFSELPEEERLQHFTVCTHFPKVELTDMTMTVEQAGLHPRGMLYVQDLDA